MPQRAREQPIAIASCMALWRKSECCDEHSAQYTPSASYWLPNCDWSSLRLQSSPCVASVARACKYVTDFERSARHDHCGDGCTSTAGDSCRQSGEDQGHGHAAPAGIGQELLFPRGRTPHLEDVAGWVLMRECARQCWVGGGGDEGPWREHPPRAKHGSACPRLPWSDSSHSAALDGGVPACSRCARCN